MINQFETQFVNRSRETNTPQVDPLFVKSLAENTLRNEFVQEELKRKGYTQFNPPYTGFMFDTIPPDLTPEQHQQWQVEQNQKRLEYFANMSDQDKLKIDEQRKAYDLSVAYMEAQVSNSLTILGSSKYGLGDLFRARLNGQEVQPSAIISIMKEKGISVQEFPDQTVGFDGKTNNGEARYINGKWTAKFNSVALGDTREVLHELAAIEAFDPYLHRKATLGQVAKAVPAQLVMLLSGKSISESSARGQYVSQGMMTIPVLESFYDIVSTFGKSSPFVQGFSKLLIPQS